MNSSEKKLLKQFNQLTPQGRDMLLSYAEFLLTSHGQDDKVNVPDKPLNIPRPEQESVVAAIKRLNANYPMLDSRHLLDEASMLMTQHVLHGREALTVIDELEALFERHFDKHQDDESITEGVD